MTSQLAKPSIIQQYNLNPISFQQQQQQQQLLSPSFAINTTSNNNNSSSTNASNSASPSPAQQLNQLANMQNFCILVTYTFSLLTSLLFSLSLFHIISLIIIIIVVNIEFENKNKNTKTQQNFSYLIIIFFSFKKKTQPGNIFFITIWK